MQFAPMQKTVPLAVLALTLGAFAAACENPVEDPPEEHNHPEGLEIVQDGATVVTVDGTDVTGHLDVQVGTETSHLTVRFLDHDGEPITSEDDNYLEVVLVDGAPTGIAEFEQDTPGEFGGHLDGLAVGETQLEFSFMHGAVDNGHPDYTSEPVTVHVEP